MTLTAIYNKTTFDLVSTCTAGAEADAATLSSKNLASKSVNFTDGQVWDKATQTFVNPVAPVTSADETLRQTLAGKAVSSWTQTDRDNALQLHLKSMRF